MIERNGNYFIIGIKGSGLSALAAIMQNDGLKVSGSDIPGYVFTQDKLEEEGIKVYPFDSNNIKPGQIIIQGNSFNDDHPEVKKAHALGLKIMHYHEFLGEYLKDYLSIGISGAHGKTTTTGLLAHILNQKEKINYLIGDGSGQGNPNSKLFVFEADEYERHFITCYPDYLIITNIDFDHPDYFRDLEDVVDAFNTLAQQTRKLIVAFGDDENTHRIQANCPIKYFGFEENNQVQVVIIKTNPRSTVFQLIENNQVLGTFETSLPGHQYVIDTAATVLIAREFGYSNELIQQQISDFKGVKRRFNVSKVNQVTIIDDYAHHPNEIAASIDSARQMFPNDQLTVIFQPHTYTRTAKYLQDYGRVLSAADRVFVTDIFSSPREKSGSVSNQDLVDLIGPKAEPISFDNRSNLNEIKNGVLLFMGAGDIQKYEQAYLKDNRSFD
ncbi:UDP-N-acetylmuramate--L-alanine ligase [Xylocopilactobacillus apicola]|uniref:UDP-N-acetylmuramate--L-alanine ligase n=1 Tax=Xylocopilactobacillus apicola TaxID=2932184 RepID=A0AAU9CX07_9LACO|nr:UDP-N-acetylmuramate--L-alanine ligase [Xylocopilactobacillus apicola]BDR58514.1 UDP-N-acetylmuramate--L-alanine ligase [Xylocopilactobacillus apicola]